MGTCWCGLVDILHTLRTYNALLPPFARADLVAAATRYYPAMSALGIYPTPKAHALLRLAARAGVQKGAPSLYALLAG